MLINKISKFKQIILTSSLLVVMTIGISGGAFAAAASTTKTKSSSPSSSAPSAQLSGTGTSVQGYSSASILQIGTIVELTSSGANSVKPVTQADAGHMYGVTVDPATLSITVSNTALQNEVYVSTAGTYNVLVSTQGGTIQTGDYIDISSIDGVGMDAGANNTVVFGRAAASFDGKSDSAATETLTKSDGSTQVVQLGIIPVAIQIQRNPNQKSTQTNLPKQLERIGLAIADKPVGPTRIYMSIAIAAISVFIVVVVLYSGIRSSFVSIGRNPLSKKSIFGALITVIFISLIILIIGLFAVYLILKL
jgi:hypothetical protein